MIIFSGACCSISAIFLLIERKYITAIFFLRFEYKPSYLTTQRLSVSMMLPLWTYSKDRQQRKRPALYCGDHDLNPSKCSELHNSLEHKYTSRSIQVHSTGHIPARSSRDSHSQGRRLFHKLEPRGRAHWCNQLTRAKLHTPIGSKHSGRLKKRRSRYCDGKCTRVVFYVNEIGEKSFVS